MSSDTDSCIGFIMSVLFAIILVPLGGVAGYYLAAPIVISLFALGIIGVIWIARYRPERSSEEHLYSEIFAISLGLSLLLMAGFAIGVRWDMIQPWLSSILLR